MGDRSNQQGFTITEMVVSLVVLSIFLTLFFQLFLAGESQRSSVLRHATASDIATTNLQKITTKEQIPPTTTACDNTTVGSANPNNLVLDPSETVGSTIAWSSDIVAENLSGTGLPSDTVQRLTVIYARGCDLASPAKILSTVTYGSETVTRAAFVN